MDVTGPSQQGQCQQDRLWRLMFSYSQGIIASKGWGLSIQLPETMGAHLQTNTQVKLWWKSIPFPKHHRIKTMEFPKAEIVSLNWIHPIKTLGLEEVGYVNFEPATILNHDACVSVLVLPACLSLLSQLLRGYWTWLKSRASTIA